MKRIMIGLLLALMILTLIVGCGKRDNPVRTRYLYRAPWTIGPRDFESLSGSIVQDPISRSILAYLPPMYDIQKHQPGLINEGFSVLYMLHDYGVDNYSFPEVYKIVQVADQLIEEEKIQPMIIVFPDAYSLFSGGSFYINSYLLGTYENYIVGELMAVIDSNLHTFGVKPDEDWLPDSRYRAISGLGMGGYGALRLAMEHGSLFTAVSAMSPYTSFESFLSREIIDKVYEENGIAAGDISYASFKSLNPWTDENHPDKTFSQIVFAMAITFSPHLLSDPDTTNYIFLTYMGTQPYGVDLPFDSTRNIPPGSAIWNRWLEYDLKTQLINDPGVFGDLDIYLDCGNQDEFKLYEGARAFSQLLSLYGKTHSYIEYNGYPDFPAGHDSFIYDRLVEVLKFHSENFPPSAHRE
jgi:esterase/lipase superfamily enzyme